VGGLDPVKMTFQSSQLVYPMRLSVAAPEPQQGIVFTLSDHRQQRTYVDAPTQATVVQFAGNVSNAVRDPLLRELAANHGSYLTKIQVDITHPARISSDFTFDNASNDDAYRQVVYVDHDVAIPIALILFAGFVFVVIAATVIVLVVLRQRRRRPTIAGPMR
jgi:hypothetical protein